MAEIWKQKFFLQSNIFDSMGFLNFLWQDKNAWPGIKDYNDWIKLNKEVLLNSEKSICFVEQNFLKSKNFEDQYEPRIYLQGEIQTREKNWHDFFNVLIWLIFPNIKLTINKFQYHALLPRFNKSKIRTPLENFLTLFDENGGIIISDDSELLQLLRNFQWKELFWYRRKNVISHMRFYLYGHSLYEKALNPYVGMTASTLLFKVDSEFLTKSIEEQIIQMDSMVVNFLENNKKCLPKLIPLPILGIPGWYKNDYEQFYENEKYFRSRKKD